MYVENKRVNLNILHVKPGSSVESAFLWMGGGVGVVLEGRMQGLSFIGYSIIETGLLITAIILEIWVIVFHCQMTFEYTVDLGYLDPACPAPIT